MSTALSSGQFPVRWAPDLRYGEPLFNFYAPLPYYIGALIHFFGFNFIEAAKILFILSSLLSAAAMYLLANKLFGRKAGTLAAVLYTWAPYRAVDIYVRGSLSETWAFVFFPLIFYCSLILAEKLSLRNLSFLGLSLAGLFLTHNVSTLMFLPFLALWWIYLGVAEACKERRDARILRFCITIGRFCGAGILGLGLAAFFLLPAYFENNFIQTKYLTVGYFNFRAHFVAVKQFFSLFWGYGSSVWGPEDGLSFQVGLTNLAVLGLAAILGVIHRKDKKIIGLLLTLGISFIFSIFLQHNKSAFIWEAIPQMEFIQFPWRFLGISIFTISIIGAIVAKYIQGKTVFYAFFIVLIILINFGYFKPKEYADDSFFNKFLQVESMQKGVDLTKDYLPIWVQNTEGERFDTPIAEKGEIKVSHLKKNSALSFSATVSDSLIKVPIAYFPGWQVKANNQIITQDQPSDTGLIRFQLPQGEYNVQIELKDTPIRTAGNIISVFSMILVALILSNKFIYLSFRKFK